MQKKYLLANSQYIFLHSLPAEGELSEWFKEHAWKVCMRETVSGVRIPNSPRKKILKTVKSLKTIIFRLFFNYTIKLISSK